MPLRQFLVSLLYLAVLTKIQLSSCLSIPLWQPHQPITFGYSRTHMHRRIYLSLRKSNDDDSGETNYHISNDTDKIGDVNNNTPKDSIPTPPLSSDVLLIMDQGLWVSDFLAMVLASQLIGLLNIVNNPEWIRKGGWFQPIGMPSTLDDLVLRISYFSIVWAVAATSVIFYTKTMTASALNGTSTNVEQNSSDRNDISVILIRNIQTLAVFGILQIVANGIIFGLGDAIGLTNNDGLLVDGTSAIPWLDVLRNCYYVGLSTSGLRFLYGRYFLLS